MGTGVTDTCYSSLTTSLRVKFPKRRQTLCSLAIRHLEDKSSSVRKFVIRVLTKLISTHPYDMYGGELSLKEWQLRLDKLDEELEVSYRVSWTLFLEYSSRMIHCVGVNDRRGFSWSRR
jgi:hypothetical protein